MIGGRARRAVAAALVVLTLLGAVPVAVTAASGAPTGSSAGSLRDLRWAPPKLSDPSTVLVSTRNRVVKLADDRDYVIEMPPVALTGAGGLKIHGGRNVVLIGGAIGIHGQPRSAGIAERRGLFLEGQTGVVHVEGLLLYGEDLTEGIQIAAPRAVVQLQNIRVEAVRAREPSWRDNHPDVVQPWGGVRELRIDGLTGRSDYQGLFLRADQGSIGRVDLRRVNLRGLPGSRYLLWREGGFHLRLQDVWMHHPDASASDWVMPRPPDATWRAVHAGVPPGGDFVPPGAVGVGYRSPHDVAIPAVPRVTVDDATMARPATGSKLSSFTLQLSETTGVPVTVEYALAWTTGGTDGLRPSSGSVTFAPGQTTREIGVRVPASSRADGIRLRVRDVRNAEIAAPTALAAVVDR